LVLHFSDFSIILYAIYKNQEISFTISVALLQQGPWKENFLCNVVLARLAGAGWPNSGEVRRGLDGEGEGDG
jgi:hypothetical protein